MLLALVIALAACGGAIVVVLLLLPLLWRLLLLLWRCCLMLLLFCKCYCCFNCSSHCFYFRLLLLLFVFDSFIYINPIFRFYASTFDCKYVLHIVFVVVVRLFAILIEFYALAAVGGNSNQQTSLLCWPRAFAFRWHTRLDVCVCWSPQGCFLHITSSSSLILPFSLADFRSLHFDGPKNNFALPCYSIRYSHTYLRKTLPVY